MCSGLFSSVQSWITRLKGPKYSPTGLETLLKEVFEDLKLTETFKPVIVPSYDINYEISVLFSTTQVMFRESFGIVPIVDSRSTTHVKIITRVIGY